MKGIFKTENIRPRIILSNGLGLKMKLCIIENKIIFNNNHKTGTVFYLAFLDRAEAGTL